MISGILFTLFGVFLGIFSGILPGVGSASILLVFFGFLINLDPFDIIMCYLGLIVSSQYMGSLTAIFTGVPGTDSSYPTAKESITIRQNNWQSKAVAQNAIASIVGNGVGMILFVLMLPVAMYIVSLLGAVATATILFISLFIVCITTEQKIISFLSILSAFYLSFIGINHQTYEVHNLGFDFLNQGLSWVSLTMGALVGYSLKTLSTSSPIVQHEILSYTEAVGSMKDKKAPLVRGTIIGFFVGLVPGLSYVLSATLCYQIEQKLLKNCSEEKRVLGSVLSSDAAHCSGILAMLIPLLVFGVPITASESVIYNVLTVHSNIKEIVGMLYDKWMFVLAALVLVNIVSAYIAWYLGGKLVKLLTFSKTTLSVIIMALSLGSIAWVSFNDGEMLLPILTFLSVFFVFYKTQTNPLPFIFGVLTFGLVETQIYSIYQLYF